MINKGKQVDRNFSEEVDNFWIGRSLDSDHFVCPNTSLFRLIGGAVGSLQSKNILEVGFAHGSDLIECKRRGANVVGLDLNQNYVDSLKKVSQCDLRQFRAGTDTIPFGILFDLIYSVDTIYYLTNNELKHFLFECSSNLAPNGTIIMQFIETDLKLSDTNASRSQNFDIDFLRKFKPHRIHASRKSPIRHLVASEVIDIANQTGLNLFGNKRMLQSYDLQENEFRVDKYLIFKHF